MVWDVCVEWVDHFHGPSGYKRGVGVVSHHDIDVRGIKQLLQHRLPVPWLGSTGVNQITVREKKRRGEVREEAKREGGMREEDKREEEKWEKRLREKRLREDGMREEDKIEEEKWEKRLREDGMREEDKIEAGTKEENRNKLNSCYQHKWPRDTNYWWEHLYIVLQINN